MRDDVWLLGLFNNIWESRFSDLERKNKVVVRFSGEWKNKFGHIKRMYNKDTEIAINALFKDEKIPEYIIELTLAHELVHYMHGFHSPHPRLFKHPHKGGVVNKELKLRGYVQELRNERKWVREVWKKDLMPETGKVVVKHLRSCISSF